MINLLAELQHIAHSGKDAGLSPEALRPQLKELLHYFVLDCIYNSSYKELIFYGGTCLRVVYNLPRLSEDLDFEVPNDINLEQLSSKLLDYFRKDIQLATKVKSNQTGNIMRTTLYFPVMYELGLSPHTDETVRIKIETHRISNDYLKKIVPVFTPKFKYGRNFVLRHYDLPTLFASKIGAILQRPKKGFTVGRPSNKIFFKGRDFFDLIWYMEKNVQPNADMLCLIGFKKSIPEIFEIVADQIKYLDLRGLYNDLMPLLPSEEFVKNFVATFKDTFEHLRTERYN